MATIASNLQAVRAAILESAVSAGRKADDIALLAVSKTFPADAVREAFAAGQRRFAESYVQEVLPKMEALKDLGIEWHFIGPIQGNKTRPIAENFAWVHSVDRLKIAERLSEQRPAGMPPLQICLQVNISGEDSKSGVAPEEIFRLAQEVARLPSLVLRGLMAIPAQSGEAMAQRAAFAELRRLYERLNGQGLALDTLSMGMSDDYPSAIAEGATMVRIGSAIFGKRNYQEGKA